MDGFGQFLVDGFSSEPVAGLGNKHLERPGARSIHDFSINLEAYAVAMQEGRWTKVLLLDLLCCFWS